MKKDQLNQIGELIKRTMHDYNYYSRRHEEDMTIAYASKLEMSNDMLFTLGYNQKIAFTYDDSEECTLIDKVIIKSGNRTSLVIENEEVI